MKQFKAQCVTPTSDSLIKFEENHRSILFRNPGRNPMLRVCVDGCQITQGLRCDHLLVNTLNGNEYFVELKGTNVAHALQQLHATLSQLSDTSDKRKTVAAFIISTNVSPKLTARIQRQKLLFKRQFRATLTVKERTLTLTL